MAVTVARIPDLSIVRSRPYQTFFEGRRRDRKNHLAIELPQIVTDNSAGRHDASRILRRQVRADNAPALAAIRCLKNYLAAVVDRIVIERIDCQWRGPMTAILCLIWRRVECMQPWADGTSFLRFGVVARDFVAVTGRPYDVRIG